MHLESETSDPDAMARTSKRPPHRPTMEVQLAWLDADDAPPAAPEIQPERPPPSSRKRPPRLPGASRTLPPMPLVPSIPPPPRPSTMEVDPSWVELVDEKKATEPDEPRGSSTRAPERKLPPRPRSVENVLAPPKTRAKPSPRKE